MSCSLDLRGAMSRRQQHGAREKRDGSHDDMNRCEEKVIISYGKEGRNAKEPGGKRVRAIATPAARGGHSSLRWPHPLGDQAHIDPAARGGDRTVPPSR